MTIRISSIDVMWRGMPRPARVKSDNVTKAKDFKKAVLLAIDEAQREHGFEHSALCGTSINLSID